MQKEQEKDLARVDSTSQSPQHIDAGQNEAVQPTVSDNQVSNEPRAYVIEDRGRGRLAAAAAAVFATIGGDVIPNIRLGPDPRGWRNPFKAWSRSKYEPHIGARQRARLAKRIAEGKSNLSSGTAV